MKTPFDLQFKAIDENNGVKRFNFSNLFCPLGVFQDDVDEVLLIQLDKIGSRRGDHVHKRSEVSLPTIKDPFAHEIQDISNLIRELGGLDNDLHGLGLLP